MAIRTYDDSTHVAMPTRPVDVLTERAGISLAVKLDEELYKAICHHLGVSLELGFSVDEVKDRGRFVRGPDKIDIFYMDATPLLEIHPIESEWKGATINFTRNFKRLYGKENSKERTPP